MTLFTKKDKYLITSIEKLLKDNPDGILPIVESGEPVLRQTTAKFNYDLPEKLWFELIEAMKITMREAPGVGLAATQIGLPWAFAVVEDVYSQADLHPQIAFDENVHKFPDGSALKNLDNSTLAPLAPLEDPNSINERSYGSVPFNQQTYYNNLIGLDDTRPELTEILDPRNALQVEFKVIVNPVYTPILTDGDLTSDYFEGCLSLPGYQAIRRRYNSIRLVSTDQNGDSHDEVFHGWPARIIQHETDHLFGQLYLDRALIRSISTDDNMAALWCDPRDIDEAESILI
jgi:peptide deformylase